jgi:CheY-like chemotaxis protein
MAFVLFIDDEPDTLVTLQKAVELFGHHANLAYSGQDALQKLLVSQPDIVFVDMNLADMSGLDVLKQLRANPQTANLPVVVLSAGPELDAAEQAHAAGAQEYMLKPVRLQALLDMIGKYVPAA